MILALLACHAGEPDIDADVIAIALAQVVFGFEGFVAAGAYDLTPPDDAWTGEAHVEVSTDSDGIPRYLHLTMDTTVLRGPAHCAYWEEHENDAHYGDDPDGTRWAFPAIHAEGALWRDVTRQEVGEDEGGTLITSIVLSGNPIVDGVEHAVDLFVRDELAPYSSAYVVMGAVDDVPVYADCYTTD